MADEVYLIDDLGTIITVDVTVEDGTDITGAVTQWLRVRKPDGTWYNWTATVYNQYYLRHTVVAGELDQAGIYAVHGKVVLETSVRAWTGEKITFRVKGEGE